MSETEIFQTDRPLLFSIAYRMLGSASDAEDVVQEAWLRYSGADRTDILQSNATFRNLLKGTTWYYYKLVSNQWAPNRNGSIIINNPATNQDNYAAMNSFPQEGVANTTMETYFQVKTPFYPNFGFSCIHCHYQAAQTDFSWVLADMAYPANPGAASLQQKGLPQMRKPKSK